MAHRATTRIASAVESAGTASCRLLEEWVDAERRRRAFGERPATIRCSMTIDYVEHGPHLRRRLIISIGFVALLIALVIGWGGGGDPSTLAAPRAPQVRPGVGSLIVSWSPPSGYATASEAEVRSYPADRACTMDGPERCTMSGVDDATPWQFSVRELIANSWTAWSARSTTVPHASIAIVAGQSNATGWESTVIDAHGKNVLTESSSPADAVVWIAWDQPNSVIPTKAGLGAAVPVPLLSDQTLSNASWPSLTGKKIFGPEISMARAALSRRGQEPRRAQGHRGRYRPGRRRTLESE